MSAEHTRPDPETIDAEEREAFVPHEADREPTPDEERLAERPLDPEVAENYEEAIERGANARGEGRID